MSQFAFLAAEFPAVHEHAARSEAAACSDPRAACLYGRLALETIVQWLYRHDASLRDPYDPTLAARIHEPSFQKLVGPGLVAKARIVKDLGNAAAHEGKAPSAGQAVIALRELFHLAYWFARTYARGAQPDPKAIFSPDALPRTSTLPLAKLGQLQEIAKRFADNIKAREEAEKQRLVSEAERDKLNAELAALRAEFAAVKAANAKAADPHDYGEAATRDAFIDLLLAEVGWIFTTPNIRSRACRTRPATGLSITCCGATMASRSRSWKPSAREKTRASASSKPSSTPIVCRRNSASAR